MYAMYGEVFYRILTPVDCKTSSYKHLSYYTVGCVVDFDVKQAVQSKVPCHLQMSVIEFQTGFRLSQK